MLKEFIALFAPFDAFIAKLLLRAKVLRGHALFSKQI